MAGVEPLPATLAYTEFLLATAGTQDLGVIYRGDDTVHAVVRVGRGVARRRQCRAVRAVGADLRRSGVRGTARLLERLLDEQADDTPAVRTAYRRAMQLELAFFDAAFTGGD